MMICEGVGQLIFEGNQFFFLNSVNNWRWTM